MNHLPCPALSIKIINGMVITAIAAFNFFLLLYFLIAADLSDARSNNKHGNLGEKKNVAGGSKGSLCKLYFIFLWLFRAHHQNQNQPFRAQLDVDQHRFSPLH